MMPGWSLFVLGVVLALVVTVFVAPEACHL